MGDAMNADDDRVKQDTFIEFKSHIGNTIVVPSQWDIDDEGDAFRLESPDGQAMIIAQTFTVDGSGTIDEFQDFVLSRIDGDWADSSWEDVVVGGTNARKRQLDSNDENAEFSWSVYVLRKGECYHAICLNATSIAMLMNGEFYEDLIKTFNGISHVP